MDEDDYVDDRLGAEAFTKLEDGESTANATQKAIEMTTDWVFGRLSTGVVAKLVMISLVRLVKCHKLVECKFSTLCLQRCLPPFSLVTLRLIKPAAR